MTATSPPSPTPIKALAAAQPLLREDPAPAPTDGDPAPTDDDSETHDPGLMPTADELEVAGRWLDHAQESAASDRDRAAAQFAMRCVRSVLAEQRIAAEVAGRGEPPLRERLARMVYEAWLSSGPGKPDFVSWEDFPLVSPDDYEACLAAADRIAASGLLSASPALPLASGLCWALLPLDDLSLDTADSALPLEMISAGHDAWMRIEADLKSYVAGETPDWDGGMAAVAVYRAMSEAALALRGSTQSVAGCPVPAPSLSPEALARLDSDSLDAIVEVVGEGAEFAAYNRGKSAMRDWFLSRLVRKA